MKSRVTCNNIKTEKLQVAVKFERRLKAVGFL